MKAARHSSNIKYYLKKVQRKKFDLEDVVLINNTVYALCSKGDIFKITDWKDKPEVEVIKTNLSKENNTEGLCTDVVTGNLLIACKNDSDVQDAKKSTRAIYELDVKTCMLKPEPFLLIHKEDFEKISRLDIDFFPSGVAVHPATHDIYIISTRDTKCMAVYSHDKVLKSFQIIEKEFIPQPEGICFSPDGTLFISTEGKDGKAAFVFQFKR